MYIQNADCKKTYIILSWQGTKQSEARSGLMN
jgi:hypothetical protein